MTDASRTFMDKENDVVIETILLSSDNSPVNPATAIPESVDILELVNSFSIFEDINSPFVVGEVTISDRLNMIDRVPIVGNEKISIFFRTPTNDRLRFMTFRVVGQKRRVRSRGSKTDVIVLRLMSESAAADELQTLSRTLRGNCSKIVKDLITDLDLDLKRDDPLIEETESNSFKLVTPFITPSQMIKNLCKLSYPKNSKSPTKNAGYVFFETIDRFVFSSVNSLMNRDPKFVFGDLENIRELTDDIQNPLRGDFSSRVGFATNNLIGNESFDKKTPQKFGAFCNLNYTHDLFRKSWGREFYIYTDDADPFADFTERSVPTNQGYVTLEDRKKVIDEDNPIYSIATKVNFYPQHATAADEANGDPTTDPGEILYDIDRYSNSNIIMLGETQYQFETSGSSELSAGDTVFLRLTKNVSDAELKVSDEDPEKSGTYLIKSIHHFFVVNDKVQSYKTSLRVVRNYRHIEVPSVPNLNFDGVIR
tara:strand:- start:750 stop:2192 length:1443 start_codon:yes stop_codon:yes gene_type:complete